MLRIEADCEDLVSKVTRIRGEYIIAKTLLADPLERLRLLFSALPAKAAIIGVVEFSLASSQVQGTSAILAEMRSAIERAHRNTFSLRTVRNTILIADSEGAEPRMSVVLEERKVPQPQVASMRDLLLGLPQLSEYDMPAQRKADPVPMQLYISIGQDPDVGMKELPYDDKLPSACRTFFALCATAVDALYAALGIQSPEQPVFIRPVKLNAPKRNPLGDMLGLGGDEEALEKAITIEKPTTTFAEIGGLSEVKYHMEGLALALKHPQLYKTWGTRPPKGVLLVGPPGNGKTLLARALANVTEASFYHVKVTDILSALYSASEQHINQVFDIARQNTPSLIFFDELDSLGHDRNRSGSETSRHMVTILLQNLDGMEELEKVVVLGATNLKDDVDPALLRAGRFDRIIPVPAPDGDAIVQILAIHITQSEKKAERTLFELPELSRFVLGLHGMSGADIAELVRRTLEVKAREQLDGKSPGLVIPEDFEREIASYERLKKMTSEMGFTKYAASQKNQ